MQGHLRILLILIALKTYSVDRTIWESTHYIWNFGLISSADKGMIKTPAEYFESEASFNRNAYHNIQPGDIVWVQCRFIEEFCKEVLPSLTCPIVLITADGDESFPSDCKPSFMIEDLIGNQNIIHVFAQNNDYVGSSTKISSIPIGIDFHTVAYKGTRGGWGDYGSPKEQEHNLNTLLSELKPTCTRKKKAFVDFHHADTMHGEFNRYKLFGEDRTTIFNRLLPFNVMDHGPWMKRSELWKTKGQYAFSISPHGNGLDCHRTWEDLILGCIVIVKTSPLDPLYDGLPVVIIQDWSEITQENMDTWLTQFGDAFTNPVYRQKLTFDYWFSKIKTLSTQHKKENYD